jgi:methionyl aminopeptidase
MSVDSPEELEGLRRAGALAARVLREVRDAVAPGVSTGELDALAAEIIASEGGPLGPDHHRTASRARSASASGDEAGPRHPGAAPGQGRRPGQARRRRSSSTATSATTATTVAVEPSASADERLIAATRAALKRGMAAATAGARLRDVGRAVERIAEGARLQRPARAHRPRHRARPARGAHHLQLRARRRAGRGCTRGLVVTIEPMIATGDAQRPRTADGWTVVTANGANSAHEEHTIVVTAGAPIVLTAA